MHRLRARTAPPLARSARGAYRLATTAAVAAIVTTCGDDGVAPLPESGPPTSFAVRADGFGYGTLTVTLHDGALVVVRAPDGTTETATTTTVTPSDADWAAFWTEARRAGLSGWPRECRNEAVSDGSGIAVDIAFMGGRVEATTFNAYPLGDGGCVRGGIDPTGEYMVFTAAVGRLIGRSFP